MRDLLDIIAEASGFHGTNREFTEFSVDHIGTGDGATTFGWGIYVSAHKAIAARYRKRGKGAIYTVDMPDMDEFLDWNNSFNNQSPAVKKALLNLNYPAIRQRMIDEEQVCGYRDGFETDSGEDIYGILATANMSPTYTPEGYMADKKKTSMMLLKAGIAGIKYHDVESGNAKLDNFCIFDPRRIRITGKA